MQQHSCERNALLLAAREPLRPVLLLVESAEEVGQSARREHSAAGVIGERAGCRGIGELFAQRAHGEIGFLRQEQNACGRAAHSSRAKRPNASERAEYGALSAA